MPDELLDIFDENNKPAGRTAMRSEVRAKGLRHHTIYVYLFRQDKFLENKLKK